MNRKEYKEALLEMIEEDETMKSNGNDYELIYVIDDIEVAGGFYHGVRSIDHNSLKFENVSWKDILTWGTVLVPETETYASDKPIQRFEEIGYKQIPLNNNHIIKSGAIQEGYAALSEVGQHYVRLMEKVTRMSNKQASVTQLEATIGNIILERSMNENERVYLINKFSREVEKLSPK